MNDNTTAAPEILFDEPLPHVARATLNRPAAKNAISPEMTLELDRLVADDRRRSHASIATADSGWRSGFP